MQAKDNPRDWGGICLATLPADRFLAIVPSSVEKQGVVQTKPFTTKGRNLLLNAQLVDTNDIKVELLDKNGAVLPRFRREASRLIRHDRLRYRVIWRNGPRELLLKDAASKQAVACRFIINSGELFAFQLVD